MNEILLPETRTLFNATRNRRVLKQIVELGFLIFFLKKQHLRIKISFRKQQQNQKPTKYILSRELTYPTFGKRKIIFKIAVEMDISSLKSVYNTWNVFAFHFETSILQKNSNQSK